MGAPAAADDEDGEEDVDAISEVYRSPNVCGALCWGLWCSSRRRRGAPRPHLPLGCCPAPVGAERDALGRRQGWDQCGGEAARRGDGRSHTRMGARVRGRFGGEMGPPRGYRRPARKELAPSRRGPPVEGARDACRRPAGPRRSAEADGAPPGRARGRPWRPRGAWGRGAAGFAFGAAQGAKGGAANEGAGAPPAAFFSLSPRSASARRRFGRAPPMAAPQT